MKGTKRILAVFLIMICFLLPLSGCSKSAKAEMLSKNLADYKAVAEYAFENCRTDQYKVKDDSIERYTVYLSELEEKADIKDSVKIAQQDFSYLWIEKTHVVFWNNEMKTMGLLYSENPKKSIQSIKTWYDEIESEKLDDTCCLIGTWRSI